MDNIFEKLEKMNKKKELKDKFLIEQIFEGLTLYNNSKDDNIKTKIKQIKNEEINDLKLIDVHLIHKNLISSSDLESPKQRHSNTSKTISNSNNNNNKDNLFIKNKKNKKREIKIFPFISSKKIKAKSSEKNNVINNINEKKLFMTKLDNMKRFRKTFNKTIENKNIKNNNFNQTFDNDNKNNKYLEQNNKIGLSPENKTIIDSKDKDKDKDKVNKEKIINLSNKIKENKKNKLIRDLDFEKEEHLIFKLLKKNEKLNKFVNNYNKRKNDNYYNYMLFKNRNKTMGNKRINNSKKNIELDTNYSPVNKNKLKLNKDYNYKINLTEKNDSKIINNTNINFPKITKINHKSIINDKNNINNNNINMTPDNNRSKINNLSINNTKNKSSLNDIISLIEESKVNPNIFKELKNREKIKRFLYVLKANNLEKDFNKDLEKRNNKFKGQKLSISKMKKKYNNILEEFDKKINFNLEEFIKEYERKDLGVNFAQFFNYLLIILVNYDKKIIKNTLEIKKESKEQPYDVRYSTVTRRHNEFMNLLDKQFNEGQNANKLLNKYLLKREDEKENNY